MPALSCGIDFGTSNSSIAVAAPSCPPRLIEIENGRTAIPSAVFYEPGQLPIFGNSAVKAYTSGNEGRFMRSLKRVLGTELMSAGTVINGKSVRFENVLAQFVRHLKAKAEAVAGREIEQVVMGRPVHFRDNDPQGDIKAEEQLKTVAGLAGFKKIVFQYEPIAAAFAHEAGISGEKLACVIDIGGGTSDFSIIKIGSSLSVKTNRSGDILASEGVRIGGNDFDKNLCIGDFMPSLGLGTTYKSGTLPVPSSQYFDLSEWSKVNSVYSYANRKVVTEVLSNADTPELYARLLEVMDKERGHDLLRRVEMLKIGLSRQPSARCRLDFLKDKPEISVSAAQLAQRIRRNVEIIRQGIDKCLHQAATRAESVNVIILTGGSTEIPYVRDRLCSMFPHAEISAENKLASVGLGLAYDSLRRFE